MVARETDVQRALRAAGLEGPARVEASRRLGLYERLLRQVALPRGFLGPGEAERLVPRHILDSVALWPFASGAESLLDVGSGAGLPGVVLACLGVPRVTLLESDRRRADFLIRAVHELDLEADVLRGRAEDLARDPRHRESHDLVVARALASPTVVVELTLPFVRVRGRAVLAVGASARDELERVSAASSLLGGGTARLEPLDDEAGSAARWALVLDKHVPTPDRYPRRVGVPSRRPLG